ncbi:TetR/AcrR family transcriptional regulator [Paenibacillus filicis]|uniref:TetR/AcrR family transcriptional regulator n=1 Tax=Paenibacillus gyeongsangnamensis TaxID=3388067 RepID=A0ABT4QCS8_9BACL|nr:TetR/AcrR family transcriptional regulator [Paenibacillus filicis]MCZ8514682.1 TetR/AcrR family transcriptional regulator [Paenibacillus filicis]
MKTDAAKDKDVKLKILDAAKKLFARQGFEGTTVRQICDEAGVALALVSYHFGGKENVFYALFETFQPDFLHKEYDLGDPAAALREFVGEFVAFRLAEPELINMLQQEIMMQSPRLEKVQTVVFSLWKQLRLILEAGKRLGQLEYGSLRHTMHFVVGTLVFSRSSSFLDPVFGSEGEVGGQEEAAKVAEFTMQFIFNGLKCKA